MSASVDIYCDYRIYLLGCLLSDTLDLGQLVSVQVFNAEPVPVAQYVLKAPVSP